MQEGRRMLELKNVCLSYGKLEVLKNISLRLARGERIALMGPSGCGKTSLLRVSAGLQKPYSGSVINSAERTAMVFQEPRLLPWLSAEDNVKLTIPACAKMSGTTVNWLEKLGIAEAAKKRPDELSGGMQQRVALARALAYEADLLLLDEPFKALDTGTKENIIKTISGSTDAAIILVTHDAGEAAALGCRVIEFDTINWQGHTRF